MYFYAQREMFSNRIALHIAESTNSGTAVARPLVMTEISDAMQTAPCVRLTTTEAQALMDELWNVGLRPSEGSGSAGAMAAIQKHLEDMRTLVFQTKP